MTQLPFSYPAIDGERLLADLHTLRGFGAAGCGVVRPSLSPEDIAQEIARIMHSEIQVTRRSGQATE